MTRVMTPNTETDTVRDCEKREIKNKTIEMYISLFNFTFYLAFRRSQWVFFVS